MLEAALHDLETVWTTQSATIVEYLAEGSSPERTRQRAAAFGLDLPDDVVTWFAWPRSRWVSLALRTQSPGSSS